MNLERALELYGPGYCSAGLMEIPDRQVVERELEAFVSEYFDLVEMRYTDAGIFIDQRTSAQVIAHAPSKGPIILPNYRRDVRHPEHLYLFKILFARLEPYEIGATIPRSFNLHGRISADDDSIEA